MEEVFRYLHRRTNEQLFKVLERKRTKAQIYLGSLVEKLKFDDATAFFSCPFAASCMLQLPSLTLTIQVHTFPDCVHRIHGLVLPFFF